MKSRIVRKKILANNHLRILISVLLICVVAGINFQIVPNINTYINSSNANNFSIVRINSKYSNHEIKHTQKAIIEIKSLRKTWHNRHHYLQLELAPVNNTRDFASNMEANAQYVAKQMQHRQIKPKEVVFSEKNTDYFDSYGYSLNQFVVLVNQHYSGEDQRVPKGTKAIETILKLAADLVMIISLLGLVYFIFKPGMNKEGHYYD